MNFYIQQHDICLINLQLCRHYNHPAGFAHDGDLRLNQELEALQDKDLPTLAADFYIAVWRARAFKSLNRATAFGALNAFLPLNCLAIPNGTQLPADILGPTRWGSKERDALVGWLSETLVDREPAFL
jgi:prophage maintenance system killer protein